MTTEIKAGMWLRPTKVWALAAAADGEIRGGAPLAWQRLPW